MFYENLLEQPRDNVIETATKCVKKTILSTSIPINKVLLQTSHYITYSNSCFSLF